MSDHLPALSADNDYLQLEIPCVPSKYVIPVEKVEKQLRKLDTSKAPGPDSIPSWVLKEFSELLAGPVAAIYNSSLREGHVPRIWRAAYVSPLPKKKPPEHIETDLRPISLTAVLCKQMEEFVVKWVWDIVQDRVDPNQYGSVKKSSPTHALVDLLHQCYTSTDASKQYARILLLDFSKAFDLINHDILLQKLASFGLPNILMKWIASFLTERTQQVKLCNTQSDWNYIHGGVPQGTKLGPVLFVLMINDVQTKCDSYKYVDDTCIVYTGSDSQAPNLQEAADNLWTIQNDMKINKSKTKELVIDLFKTRTNFPTIRIDGTDTQRVTEAKILGITITSNLTWDVHVDEITRKAGKRLFLLLQLKRSGIPVEDLLTVYTTVVRPTLEYACPAWSTSLTLGLQSDMERVQRRAMNIIYPNTTYTEALANAQLPSLKQRRAQICEHFFTQIEEPQHKLHKYQHQELQHTIQDAVLDILIPESKPTGPRTASLTGAFSIKRTQSDTLQTFVNADIDGNV